MKVICISGRAESGKDTAAQMLKQYMIEDGKKALVTHYADLLKYICSKYLAWNGEKDEAGRSLLQYVGTDVFRKQDPNFWVNFVITMLQLSQDLWDHVIIPDCRFPNEIELPKKIGFDVTHVRVERPGFVNVLTEEQGSHPSETALDGVKADHVLINDGTLKDLRKSVGLLAETLQ